jgi:protein-S-isoprenylcysteine O-methyltransferase Ste14
MLLARAILAFLALPATVGMLVPALLLRGYGTGAPRPAGAVLAALGLAGLLWCVRDFLVRGRGTLAPWDPPRRLVVGGLYRFVRNPMYLSVLALVAGIAWWRAAAAVGWYAAFLALAFHVRVVGFEEPWLARTFPEEWPAYSGAVRRWLPGRPR